MNEHQYPSLRWRKWGRQQVHGLPVSYIPYRCHGCTTYIGSLVISTQSLIDFYYDKNRAHHNMNVDRVSTFDPTATHATSLSELRSLDMYPGMGLAEGDFWALFSKCTACHNFMTTRTIPYHVCPGTPSGQFPSLSNVLCVPNTYPFYSSRRQSIRYIRKPGVWFNRPFLYKIFLAFA